MKKFVGWMLCLMVALTGVSVWQRKLQWRRWCLPIWQCMGKSR